MRLQAQDAVYTLSRIALPPPAGRATSHERWTGDASSRREDRPPSSSSNIARLGRSGKLRPRVVGVCGKAGQTRATGAFQTREGCLEVLRCALPLTLALAQAQAQASPGVAPPLLLLLPLYLQ